MFHKLVILYITLFVLPTLIPYYGALYSYSVTWNFLDGTLLSNFLRYFSSSDTGYDISKPIVYATNLFFNSFSALLKSFLK